MAASKSLILSNEGNELECYLNIKNNVYITVGDINSEFPDSRGYITLDKSDVKELIKELKSLEKQM